MVGNNLARDVRGANQVGITSVYLNWTTRYPRTPADPLEEPDYTITEPLELSGLAERLTGSFMPVEPARSEKSRHGHGENRRCCTPRWRI